MESSSNKAGLYTELRPWQTRVIELKPPGPSEALTCKMHIVDIILFEGVVIHDSQKRIDYQALSYSWGSFDISDNLTCDGRELQISSNLGSALRTLRTVGSASYFWVDAICINQQDNVEKSAQVSIILEIYRKASEVVIWLGGEEGLDRLGLSRLAYSKTNDADHDKNDSSTELKPLLDLDDVGRQEVIQTFRELYKRPWFSRTWVRQELYAARSLQIICGSYRLIWDRIRVAAALSLVHDRTWINDNVIGSDDMRFTLGAQKFVQNPMMPGATVAFFIRERKYRILASCDRL